MKVVNVVSGKGGTGKTLVTAVLAELLSRRNNARVLIVDMDIFVRGLTSLLYFQSDKRLHIIERQRASVSDVISTDEAPLETGIVRYMTFDVWPAVSRIDQKLLHNDVMPDNFEVADKRVTGLLKRISSEYDFVFLDSRAGYDELIAATHRRSDVTINVGEDDLVSRVTSDNLTAQLETVAGTPIYGIINKSLGRHSDRPRDLGRIPFDADIMRSYGEESFWANISKSMLEPALVEIWNQLSRNEGLGFFLKSNRSSPIPSQAIEKTLSRVTLVQRVTLVYGLMISVGGLLLALVGRDIFHFGMDLDPFRLLGVGLGVIGLMLIYFAVTNVIARR